MATYYIDPDWTGTTSGSQAQPYNNFSQVPSLAAGDQVLFKRGTVYPASKAQVAPAQNGSSGNHIVLGSYGSGALPIIQRSDYPVLISGRSYITVQELHAQRATSFTTAGIMVLNSEQVLVQNNEVTGCHDGIRVDNTGSTALRNIRVLNNTVHSTVWNNGILVVWGTSSGGTFEDVTIDGNRVSNTGQEYTGPASGHFPGGIRCLSRKGGDMTTTSGTVDLDGYFGKGFVVTRNILQDIAGYGLALTGIKQTGGSATLLNRVAYNQLINCCDGEHDAHMLWLATCRDFVVEFNTVNGSTAWQGHNEGTGVGIFIDNPTHTSETASGRLGYDGCNNITVRYNRVLNTGRKMEGSLNTSEIAGAGVLVLASTNISIYGNTVQNCNTGIGVIGWFGFGKKSDTVSIRGNRVVRPKTSGVYTARGAANVTVSTNSVWGQTEFGVYVENSGAQACTGYTESNNTVAASANHYGGGSQPTSTTVPAASRTPGAGNLVSTLARLTRRRDVVFD